MIYLNLFITFFKIGLFTIGGGYAMIPLIQQEVIDNGWLNMTQLIDFLAVAESTPGPFAVNIATFVGMETGGLLGAVTTTTAVVLPSLIIIIAIAKLFAGFQKNKWVQGALYGIRPVIVGLIASAALTLMSKSLLVPGVHITNVANFIEALYIREIVIFLTCAFIYFKYQLHPIKLVFLSAALGIFFFGLWPILTG